MIRRHWRALAFLLLLGGGLYAVLATSLGLHLAYQVARTYAPGELQVRHLEGSWLGPLRLEGMRYRQDGQDHAIGRLWLDWRPAALLRGVFELTALEVEGVVLELGPGGGAPDPEPEPGAFQPHFNLPIGVRITHLDIRDVRVTRLGDLLVQLDEMGIETGYEIDRVLWLGAKVEKTVGRRLRSEAVVNGRTEKSGNPRFARPGLRKLISELGERPGQLLPQDWSTPAQLPERWGPAAW